LITACFVLLKKEFPRHGSPAFEYHANKLISGWKVVIMQEGAERSRAWNFAETPRTAGGRYSAVAYCRYAGIYRRRKGTKQQAEIIPEECKQFLEMNLKLQLNMEKTALTT
jgi:hypothetical protein